MKMEKGSKILDLGCGFGISSEILKEFGYEVVGIDICERMVNFCKEKGINAILGDFRELEKYFKKDEFDYGISVSSLQWISKDRNSLTKFAKGCNHVIKKAIGIQFYPFSFEELNNLIRVLRKYFGNTECYIFDKGTKKERIYVISKKKI